MINVRNPILPGFNPDPSIIHVDGTFYIATSTFEWFPGVQIHESDNLEEWKFTGRALDKVEQLDMSGLPDSCGVWAPCLSYDNGTYYLVYSNVKSFDPLWGNTPNYLVTTTDLNAGWSNPVFLSNAGFDGSLFHDEDGRKWYLSLRLDEANQNIFGGIVLQEYSEAEKRLIGDSQIIFEGTELGITEGPHLYKIDGYYYLITAEGGTEYDHAVSVARSTKIEGPYEPSPFGPIIHTSGNPDWPLQKTGHGDLVEDDAGNWFLVFLTSRPLTTRGRCTLGRETAIEEIIWQDGWPKLKVSFDSPRLVLGNPSPHKDENHLENFTKGQVLHQHWQSLREPITNEWLRLGPNGLTLLGRKSLQSWENQSLIARRVSTHAIAATTEITFDARTLNEAAGLVYYYNSIHYHYLQVTFDQQPVLRLVTCDKGNEMIIATQSIQKGPIFLKGLFKGDTLTFFWKQSDQNWQAIGGSLDGSILSDDYVQNDNGTYRAAFTGSFVGLCCQDLSGDGAIALFKSFQYIENP